MDYYDTGVRDDVAGSYTDAIKHYEREISENPRPNVNAFINLAFIYWIFALEPAFVINSPHSEEISSIGGERFPQVIEEGLKKFSDNLELRFWAKYFSHILFGKEFSRADCERLIATNQNKDTLVPYFFLWLFDADRYDAERRMLLQQCENLPTAKNRYIKSILLQHKRHG
jgi:hypothetical protein